MYQLIITMYGEEIEGKEFSTLEEAEKSKIELQNIYAKNGINIPVRIQQTKTISKLIFDKVDNEYFGSYTTAIYGRVWFFARDNENKDGTLDIYKNAKEIERICMRCIEDARFWRKDVNPTKVIENICYLLHAHYDYIICLIDECWLKSANENYLDIKGF